MRHTLKNRNHAQQSGFTFVEIVIIAPIVILMIGAFVAVVVGMTGQVLASRASNVLTYNVQDALNRIEDDVKLSSTFLATNNIVVSSPSQASDLQSGQGYDNGTGSFTNVGTNGTMLILNDLATTGNPLDNTSQVAYLSNQPNACGAFQGQNTPLRYNVVYYTKTVNGVSSLWRRAILPGNYASTACNAIGSTTPGVAAPWQQPSCVPGYNPASYPFCKTGDVDLVDGVAPSGFSVDYYPTSNGTTTDTTAVTGTDPVARGNAMLTDTTVNVSIDAIQSVAGRSVEQTASMRVTRLDTNASTIAATTVPTAPSVPSVTGSAPNTNGTVGTSTNLTQTTFTWAPSTGGGTMSYALQYRLNGGSWNAVSNSSITYNSSTGLLSYVIPGATYNQTYDAQVQATNSAGTSAWSSTATVAIPLWATPILQNTWTNYGGAGYNPAGTTYATAGYTKTSAGLVVLKGLVKAGSSYPSPIFVLPAGYRPSTDLLFWVTAGSDSTGARIDVLPDGSVYLEVGSNGYVSLDTIRFMPAPTDASFTSFASLGNWTNYLTPSYAAAGYYVDSAGRVQLQGLIKGGSGTIWTYPTTPALKPAENSYIPEVANNAYGEMSHQPTGGLVWVAGSNAFFSIQNMYYPSGAATWTNLTLTSPWTYYGSPFTVTAATKGNDGLVSVKGFVHSGSAGSTIAVLPAGMRPKQELMFNVAATDAFSRIDIFPSGNIYMVSGTATWVSLDDITFMAEQ